MAIERSARAEWAGTLKHGQGAVYSDSGILDGATYTFPSRFESGQGTNSEELIAAAHAACFSMALSLNLEEGGAQPHLIRTSATVQLEKEGEGFAITAIHLNTEVEADNITQDDFQKTAEKTKDGCPVSKLLKPGLKSLSLEAKLL